MFIHFSSSFKNIYYTSNPWYNTQYVYNTTSGDNLKKGSFNQYAHYVPKTPVRGTVKFNVSIDAEYKNHYNTDPSRSGFKSKFEIQCIGRQYRRQHHG